jgi:hypothetical protein
MVTALAVQIRDLGARFEFQTTDRTKADITLKGQQDQ